ncbi:MAG: IS630 family transposase [Bryobacteraceae bacterium]
MSDTSTRILQRPEVRATDGGKASLKIGQRIPYVSGSLNSAIATPGAIPYATTQFQQVDVGTEIDFQPHVNGPHDITMHVKVSLTNVLKQVEIAGIQEPDIGQQVDEADIRMKDGEVSLLGGLSDVEQTATLSGFPGLTNLPLLDYLFGSKYKDNTDDEILIALVPHIVRSSEGEMSIAAERGVYAGTDRVVHVDRGPEGTPVTPGLTPAIPPRSVPPAVSTPLAPTPNPPFVEKIRDVAGLYVNPPDHAMVLCVDEKSQVQALDRTQPILPLRPGLPELRTHDNERNGTTSLFAAWDIASGKVIGQCYRRHRQQEFLKFLEMVNSTIPSQGEVHLVLDNYGTHKAPKVVRWFARHPRYRIHFTPTSASWVNQVERWFAEITEKRIRRGSFDGVRSLEKAIREYLEHHNQTPKPFVWTADADLILGKVQRLCERISDSGH